MSGASSNCRKAIPCGGIVKEIERPGRAFRGAPGSMSLSHQTYSIGNLAGTEIYFLNVSALLRRPLVFR
jgi:hypothetical protein